MNERLQNLAREAGHFEFNKWDYFDINKFAELIVRECVTIINHGIDHTEYPHPNDSEKSMIEMKAQMWCRDAIKEHFGVDKQTE